MSNEPLQPDRDEIIRKLMLFRKIVAETEGQESERSRIENELWRTETMSQAVVRNSPIGITVRSADNRLLLFNDAWLRIWGLTAQRARELDQQTEGWPVEQRYSYLGQWAEQVRAAFAEGRELFVPEVSLAQYTPRQADWVSLHFYPIRGEQGQVEAVVTLTQDISARKTAEQELAAVKSRLELLLRSTPAVIFTCRANGENRTTFISQNVEQVLGYDAGQWLSDPAFWMGRVHPDDRRAIAATGLDDAPGRARVREYRFRHSDGIYRWLYEESNPIPAAAGAPAEIAGYFIDVTARKWAEETLRESEQRFRTLLDNLRDIVVTCHSSGTITSLNPAFEAVTGWPREGMIGKPMIAMLHADDNPATAAAVAACLRGETVAPFEARTVTKAGQTLTLEFHITPQVKDGAVTGLLGVARDITVRKQAEQELRRSEHYYHGLFEHAHDPIIVLAPEGERVLDVNPRACEVYGFTRQEFLAMSLEAISRDVERGRQQIRQTLERGSYLNFETVQFRKDGTALTIEVNASVIDFNGRPAILSINRDVSERRRAEAELRASEALTRAVVEHSPIGISVRSPQGRLLSYNRAWQEIWSMTEQEIRQDLETERAELRFDRKDNYLRDWLPQVERIYRQGGTLFIPELTIAKPAIGGERHIAQYFYAIPGAGAAVDRVVIITQDITEHRQSLQEITILAQAIKSTSECISITDDQDILLFVNDSFCRTYGYTREQLIGRHIGMVLSPQQDQSCLVDIPARTLAGGWQGELLNRRRDGSDFPIFLSTAVVRDEHGAPAAMIGVARDITEQKRAEAQREKLREAVLQAQKLEAMSTMAGGVAHDFNNLLTVIQGSAEMLHLGLREGDPLLADVERIVGAAAQAAGLTHQLLLFSRRQPLDLAACNVNRAVEDLLRAMRERIPAAVRVELALADDLKPARGDGAAVGQALEALLANALEAMPQGGTLAVRTENCLLDEAAAATMPEGRSGPFVRVTVADSGGGIGAGQAPHIFEPFYSTKGAGRGLGLSAAYGIVKQFDGWITFYSEPGQGTVFSVYLPQHMAEQARPAVAAPAPETAGGQQLVLMVEDEPGIMKVFSSILRMKGYRVAEAADLAQARAQFQQSSAEIALVFSDILLPDGNGLDLVEELSAIKPGVKVVLTSGYTEDDARLARIKQRGYAFLPKPYNLPSLLRVLGETLAK